MPPYQLTYPSYYFMVLCPSGSFNSIFCILRSWVPVLVNSLFLHSSGFLFVIAIHMSPYQLTYPSYYFMVLCSSGGFNSIF